MRKFRARPCAGHNNSCSPRSLGAEKFLPKCLQQWLWTPIMAEGWNKRTSVTLTRNCSNFRFGYPPWERLLKNFHFTNFAGNIRRPLLARGIKAAGLGIVRFLTINGHAFSYKAMLLTVFRTQIGSRLPAADPGLEIRFSIQNPSDFEIVFKTTKTRETDPKALQKRKKSTRHL